MADAKFINPYNFFPLTNKKKLVSYTNRDQTGVIEYSVLTRTPLFIPNTSCSKRFPLDDSRLTDEERMVIEDHKLYDFFSYENLKENEDICYKPVIPGSEIRGMFRSNFEILTESCLLAYDEHAVLGKRTMERFKEGLLRKNAMGGYDLYQAKSYSCQTIRNGNGGQNTLVEGQQVEFKKVSDCKVKRLIPVDGDHFNQGNDFGYIMKGERGPSEKSHHVFAYKDEPAIYTQVSLDTLERALDEYDRNTEGAYSEYRTQYNQFKGTGNAAAFPVYYSAVEKHLMLSPACITREIYSTTMKELLRDFAACSDKQKLCPACSLFGMVNQGTSTASRIRFTDLHPEERKDLTDYYDRPITLAPLSSPKISNMEFYFKQPAGARFWTFAYYINEQDKLILSTPEISGRKFYWHQIGCSLPPGIKKTGQNMTVRPLKKNVLFTGKLYFQDISMEELDQLIWLLNAGEDGEISKKSFGYKLGAAKPLGLGSIAVSVDKVMSLRKTVAESGLVGRKNEEYPQSCREELFDNGVIRNYKKMTNFNTVKGKNVSYPIAKNQTVGCGPVIDGYRWFVENHKKYRKNNRVKEGVPHKRMDMYYREHMVAMEPELQLTCEAHECSLNKGNGAQTHEKMKNRPYRGGR